MKNIIINTYAAKYKGDFGEKEVDTLVDQRPRFLEIIQEDKDKISLECPEAVLKNQEIIGFVIGALEKAIAYFKSQQTK